MALTDPELALLLQAAVDMRSQDLTLRAAEELLRRRQFAQVAALMGDAQQANPSEAGWPVLARARFEVGDPVGALEALAAVSHDPTAHPDRARLAALCLEAAGRPAEARRVAEALLALDGDDLVAAGVVERLDDPPFVGPLVSPDPAVTPERVEQYLAQGHADRALRWMRRLVHHNPTHPGLRARLADLLHAHPDADERSRENTADSVPFAAPAPLDLVPRLGRIGAGDDDEDTLVDTLTSGSLSEALARAGEPS